VENVFFAGLIEWGVGLYIEVKVEASNNDQHYILIGKSNF